MKTINLQDIWKGTRVLAISIDDVSKEHINAGAFS